MPYFMPFILKLQIYGSCGTVAKRLLFVYYRPKFLEEKMTKEIFVSKIYTSKDKLAEIYVTKIKTLINRELNIKIVIDPKETISLSTLFEHFVENKKFDEIFEQEMRKTYVPQGFYYSQNWVNACNNFNTLIIRDSYDIWESLALSLNSITDHDDSQESATFTMNGKQIYSSSFKDDISIVYDKVKIKAQSKPKTTEMLETFPVEIKTVEHPSAFQKIPIIGRYCKSWAETVKTKYTVKFTIETR